MHAVYLFIAVVVGVVVVGCAGPHTGGTFQSKASYDKVYAASLAAVDSLDYTITSSNKADGLIVAQQGVVMGKGSTVGLNAHVYEEAGKRILRVNISAPPGTLALGDFDENLTEYVDTVKKRVPDLKPYP